MNKIKAIAIFDIGKTNKKILLFDEHHKVVYLKEEKFKTTLDEDGFECDDISLIEKWIKSSLSKLVKSNIYDIIAVNFSSYGASLVFLDNEGKRLTPLYNYLKNISPSIRNTLFEKYGGKAEFCRKTASPSFGNFLNSGIQILWLKKERPEIFKNTKSILHLPQYLSFLFTSKITSEPTSIGCHTFLWDFDRNQYHSWLKEEKINLPDPISNLNKINIKLEGKTLVAGIGIHDSSAALVPYLVSSKQTFLLISTGTWCINMNPFNSSPLTHDQLKNDCLFFLNIHKQPVKASRLFLGHIHDTNVKYLALFFKVPADFFKKVKTEEKLLERFLKNGCKTRLFFKNGIPVNYIDLQINLSQFSNFSEAYHRLVYDLALLNLESIKRVLTKDYDVERFYITGGFVHNKIFTSLLASFYPDKEVYTSKVDNASALGANLLMNDLSDNVQSSTVNLGLERVEPIVWNT